LIVALAVLAAATDALAQRIRQEERDYQAQAFEVWFDTELVRTLDVLPSEGKVADFRVPYSGFIYPDRGGGTDIRLLREASPLVKYDTAFNDGRGLAVAHERMDVTAHREFGAGLFGGRQARLERLERPVGLLERMRAMRAPSWHGHCNGWTAASIRHAEPQRAVVRNGVTFTPADIKALLAEIYMYSDTEFLGGVDTTINPGVLHITLANWLGRGDHPVGMDEVPGEVVYNYPIYAYKATINKLSDRQAEVRLVATYANYTNREFDKAPQLKAAKHFHYALELDSNGEIIGGSYYRDSARIDMLWTPLKPIQGGQAGNELGNPHIDVKQVISIWRDSVPKELREKWLNVDPILDEES